MAKDARSNPNALTVVGTLLRLLLVRDAHETHPRQGLGLMFPYQALVLLSHPWPWL